MACADVCGHAEPDTVRAPQPSQATTARPARRSASPASRGGTRACPSSATSPATRPAPPPPLAPSPSPGDRKGYAYLRLGSAMRRGPGRDATRRAAEGGSSGAEAHGPVAPGACLRSPAPGGWPGGSGSPLPRPRPRREGLRDRQAGRQGPARLRPDGGDPRGAPARVPRGHCGGQDDVGRAGLAQDLARSRVDARGPARATRDRAPRAAGHHRAREEDERGARAFGIRCPDTIRLPVVSQGSAGNSGLLRAGREPWRPQQRSARHSRAGPHQEGVHLHRPAREKLTSGEGVAGQAVPAVL